MYAFSDVSSSHIDNNNLVNCVPYIYVLLWLKCYNKKINWRYLLNGDWSFWITDSADSKSPLLFNIIA